MLIIQAPFATAELSTQHIGDIKHWAVAVQGFGDTPTRQTRGTGFKVRYMDRKRKVGHEFIITTKHVLDGVDRLKIYANRNLNERDSKAGKSPTFSFDVPLYSSGGPVWFTAPDNVDLAAVYLGGHDFSFYDKVPDSAQKYAASSATDAPEQNWLANYTLELSSDTDVEAGFSDSDLPDMIVTGYPFVAEKARWWKPFMRRCTISQESAGGLPIGDANPNYFLIDCPALEGDSGAPVFMKKASFSNERTGLLEYSTSLQFVGILANEVTVTENFDMRGLKISKTAGIHMSTVIPARYVKSTIEAFLSSQGNKELR